MKKFRIAAGLLTLPMLAGVIIWLALSDASPARAKDAPSEPSGPQPVEESMHEFMEYVFQPTYKRLKAQMAAEPADNAGWKAIKSDSLILAEASNLLWVRQPKEGKSKWQEYTAQVRQMGGLLYQAARKKDYTASREHYQAMLKQCNRCHQKFAEGKYQLQP